MKIFLFFSFLLRKGKKKEHQCRSIKVRMYSSYRSLLLRSQLVIFPRCLIFFFLVSSFLSKSLVVVVGGKEHFIREKRDTMRHKEKEKKSLCSCREMKDYASPCAVTHSPLLRDSRDERHKLKAQRGFSHKDA